MYPSFLCRNANNRHVNNRALGAALRGNNYVQHLELTAECCTPEVVNEDFHYFLSHSPSLKILHCTSWRNESVVAATLRSICTNVGLESLDLQFCAVPVPALVGLIKEARQLKKLSLLNTTLTAATNGGPLAGQIDACFPGSDTITELTLSLDYAIHQVEHLIPLFSGVAKLSQIKKLEFIDKQTNRSQPISFDLGKAIGQLLESSASRNMSLILGGRISHDAFEPIQRSLRGSQSVTELEMDFYNAGTFPLLEGLFTGSSNMRALTIAFKPLFHPSDLPSDLPWGNLLANILRNESSTLKSLTLKFIIGETGNPQFLLFLDSLMTSSCRLTDFTWSVDGEAQLEAVIERLPRFSSLNNLTLVIYNDALFARRKDALLKALRENGSLESVSIRNLDYPPGRKFTTQLEGICDRNVKIRRLVAFPKSVPAHEWPDVLESAMQCNNWLDSVWTAFRGHPEFVLKSRGEQTTTPTANARAKKTRNDPSKRGRED